MMRIVCLSESYFEKIPAKVTLERLFIDNIVVFFTERYYTHYIKKKGANLLWQLIICVHSKGYV